MPYQMGCVELIGWMILGGFLGGSLCGIAVAATGRPLDLGTGLAVFFGSVVLVLRSPWLSIAEGSGSRLTLAVLADSSPLSSSRFLIHPDVVHIHEPRERGARIRIAG